jgi:hypothetical protein
MNWFKKHADTVAILAGVLASVLWMNGKFSDVDKRFNEVYQRISIIEKDIAVMKAVLIMQKILPTELAHVETEK